jgi:hypothetical protein
MSLLVAIALASVSSFGPSSAEATVIDADTVEIAVEVEAARATSIVLHAIDVGSEDRTVAMLETRPGEYRTRFETRPIDLVIVFEDVASGAQSDPVRLTDLGVAPELVGVLPLEPLEEAPNSPLGWLGLALGLASLSALAFWALGGRDGDDPSAQPAQEADTA